MLKLPFFEYFRLLYHTMDEWKPVVSRKNGKVYWFNTRTKKSSWKNPNKKAGDNKKDSKKASGRSVLALVDERLLADALGGKHKEEVHVLHIGCGGKGNTVLDWLRKRQRDNGGSFRYVGVDTTIPEEPSASSIVYYCHDVVAEGLPVELLDQQRRFDVVLVQGLQFIWRSGVIQDIAAVTKYGGTFCGTLANYTILEKIVKGTYKSPNEYTIESDVYYSPSEGGGEKYIAMQGRAAAAITEDEFVSTLRTHSFLPLVSSSKKDKFEALESMVNFVHKWAYMYQQVEMDDNTCQLMGMLLLFRATRRDELFRAVYE